VHLSSFANGLRNDIDAVTAGADHVSQTQAAVEGAVNKTKIIKRQMFGTRQLRPASQACASHSVM
jgi:transposase